MSTDPLPENSQSASSTTAADRRKTSRRRVSAKISMTIETSEIEGVTDNISMVGVLFFSQEAVRVRMEIEEDGELRSMTGKLVRAQRMKESNTGFAVEFDPE